MTVEELNKKLKRNMSAFKQKVANVMDAVEEMEDFEFESFDDDEKHTTIDADGFESKVGEIEVSPINLSFQEYMDKLDKTYVTRRKLTLDDVEEVYQAVKNDIRKRPGTSDITREHIYLTLKALEKVEM